MKKYFLFLILIVLGSCSKDDNKDLSAENNLSGKWNWIVSTAANGSTMTPKSIKQIMVVEFEGSSIKTYVNDFLYLDLKYQVKTQQSVYGGNKKVIVIDHSKSLIGQEDLIQSFEIVGNKLYLRDECTSCQVHEYERVK